MMKLVTRSDEHLHISLKTNTTIGIIMTCNKKIKEFPTLYKLSSAGKVQIWEITCYLQLGDEGLIIIEHGQLGGKIQETSEIIVSGKNIGKANETSIWEQTQAEVESKWNKQVDRKGYSEKIPSQKQFRPMLAKKYNSENSLDELKDGKHIVFPAYVQPKLDGIRCTAHYEGGKVVLKSRQGKVFESIPHIAKDVEAIFKLYPDVILDGELYVHDKADNFQEIISAVKRDKPNELSKNIQYHVYDVVVSDIYCGYEGRKNFLHINFQSINSLVLVPSYDVSSHAELRAKYAECIKLGYEGAMVRNMEGPYKIDGRSADLQKIKEFQEEEFAIVGAERNKGKMSNQCTFICITKDGHRFGVKPKGTAELREQYWKDWNNGTIKSGNLLTVQFFSWTTSDNPVPRFPVGKTIRDYE